MKTYKDKLSYRIREDFDGDFLHCDLHVIGLRTHLRIKSNHLCIYSNEPVILKVKTTAYKSISHATNFGVLDP